MSQGRESEPRYTCPHGCELPIAPSFHEIRQIGRIVRADVTRHPDAGERQPAADAIRRYHEVRIALVAAYDSLHKREAAAKLRAELAAANGSSVAVKR